MIGLRFDPHLGELIERDPFCSLFDLGGRVQGGSSASATQDATVQFIPSATPEAPPPLVSTYPAGPGLLSLNSVLPSSAYFGPTGPLASSGSASSSWTTIIILGAIGVGAWWLLRKRK